MVEAIGDRSSSESGSDRSEEGASSLSSGYFYMPSTEEQIRNVIRQLGYEFDGTFREQRHFLEEMLDTADKERFEKIMQLMEAESRRTAEREAVQVNYNISSQVEGHGAIQIQSVDKNKSLVIRVKRRNSQNGDVFIATSLAKQAAKAADIRQSSMPQQPLKAVSVESNNENQPTAELALAAAAMHDQAQQDRPEIEERGQEGSEEEEKKHEHPAEEEKEHEHPAEEEKELQAAREEADEDCDDCPEEGIVEMKARFQMNSINYSTQSYDPATLDEDGHNRTLDYEGVHSKGATKDSNLFGMAKTKGVKIHFAKP